MGDGDDDDKTKANQRERTRRWRAKHAAENKERARILASRQYYRDKGVIPQDYTAIGRWCKEKGYSIQAVMDGTQPI